MNLYTAATLGHKHARAFISLLIENGLIMSNEAFLEYIGSGKEFEYLTHISDIKSFLKSEKYSLIEYKQEVQSKSIINLYLSSLADLPHLTKGSIQAASTPSSLLSPTRNLEESEDLDSEQRIRNRKMSVMAQMMLGYKYLHGLGVNEKCKPSALYYEEAAIEAIRYVEESFGLDVVERRKLSIGPHVLQD